MYISSNSRIASNSDRLSFTCPTANISFSVQIEFVSEKDGHGRIKKGVKFHLPQERLEATGDEVQIPLPPGVQLRDEMGNPMAPGDGHVLPKGHNACSVNIGNENYELFSVGLVDASEGDPSGGGVLYFPDSRTIPEVFGGKGLLMENPRRGLE